MDGRFDDRPMVAPRTADVDADNKANGEQAAS
jgi:hypothetical protein